MTTIRPKQHGKAVRNNTFPSSTHSKKKRPNKQKTEIAALAACVVECGHDSAKDSREHPQQHQHDQQGAAHVCAPPAPGFTLAQKELHRTLEAGLMINGLKVLFMSLAEKIELHVNHNVITPELLQELDDVAQATLLTTKKLKTLKAPCCDLYTIPASSADDDDNTE